jgi:hypothetical protein
MSADNWGVCPVCSSKDPFLGNGDDARTWREDYEIGLNTDGSFDVRYQGGCRVCGTTHTFHHCDPDAVQVPRLPPSGETR